MGDLKAVHVGSIDATCKRLQVRRIQQKNPGVLFNEDEAVFGDFLIPASARGLDSVRKYDNGNRRTWEIGKHEYLLMPVYGTAYKKEIYHVPSLTVYDSRGKQYLIEDGYFGVDDNEKGRPLIFEKVDKKAKLVGYENLLRFRYYGV